MLRLDGPRTSDYSPAAPIDLSYSGQHPCGFRNRHRAASSNRFSATRLDETSRKNQRTSRLKWLMSSCILDSCMESMLALTLRNEPGRSVKSCLSEMDTVIKSYGTKHWNGMPRAQTLSPRMTGMAP